MLGLVQAMQEPPMLESGQAVQKPPLLESRQAVQELRGSYTHRHQHCCSTQYSRRMTCGLQFHSVPYKDPFSPRGQVPSPSPTHPVSCASRTMWAHNEIVLPCTWALCLSCWGNGRKSLGSGAHI